MPDGKTGFDSSPVGIVTTSRGSRRALRPPLLLTARRRPAMTYPPTGSAGGPADRLDVLVPARRVAGVGRKRGHLGPGAGDLRPRGDVHRHPPTVRLGPQILGGVARPDE